MPGRRGLHARVLIVTRTIMVRQAHHENHAPVEIILSLPKGAQHSFVKIRGRGQTQLIQPGPQRNIRQIGLDLLDQRLPG
jgi:hypothetical protein